MNATQYKIIGIVVLLAALLLSALITRAPHWGFDGFGFFAGFGFVSSGSLILISKFIGRWLKRKEDYYDD